VQSQTDLNLLGFRHFYGFDGSDNNGVVYHFHFLIVRAFAFRLFCDCDLSGVKLMPQMAYAHYFCF
jgi:hypothetical protein